MAVYLIIPLGDNYLSLADALEDSIPSADRYPLSNNAGWFAVFPGTTVELSNVLKVTGQPPGSNSPVGSALITPVTSYYGRGSSEMWEWLKTRLERAT